MDFLADEFKKENGMDLREVLQQQQLSAQPLLEEEQGYAITINTESSNALETLLDHFEG